MPQTRRNVYIAAGSALCLGGLLVLYAAARHWLPLIGAPTGALSQRPDLALIALLGASALAGGASLLARALLPQPLASGRNVGIALGATLGFIAAIGLIYTAQGLVTTAGQGGAPTFIQAWTILGVVSVAVLLAGARAIYDAVRGARSGRSDRRSGARHTPPEYRLTS
jgi:hypothetical protein